jgi:hypothetical protein
MYAFKEVETMRDLFFFFSKTGEIHISYLGAKFIDLEDPKQELASVFWW